MLNQNPATARLGYEYAKKVVQDAGYSDVDSILTQSDLILERQLVTTSNIYEFPVLDTQQGASGPAFNTERRLKLQDAFIGSSIGMFPEKPTSAVDTTFIPQTYPNDQVFASANTATSLNTVYNGYINISMNGTILVPFWSCQKHRHVPQTQQSATVTAAQVDLDFDGFVSLEPNIIFQGTKNMIVQLILPAGLVAVETFERWRIHYRGYLAQNCTILK
jgi:hypothetical protein